MWQSRGLILFIQMDNKIEILPNVFISMQNSSIETLRLVKKFSELIFLFNFAIKNVGKGETQNENCHKYIGLLYLKLLHRSHEVKQENKKS